MLSSRIEEPSIQKVVCAPQLSPKFIIFFFFAETIELVITLLPFHYKSDQTYKDKFLVEVSFFPKIMESFLSFFSKKAFFQLGICGR